MKQTFNYKMNKWCDRQWIKFGCLVTGIVYGTFGFIVMGMVCLTTGEIFASVFIRLAK